MLYQVLLGNHESGYTLALYPDASNILLTEYKARLTSGTMPLRISIERLQIQDQLVSLSFAGRLWQLFRATMSDTINEFVSMLGYSVDTVMLAIDKRVHELFIRSLQLDVFTLQLEHE